MIALQDKHLILLRYETKQIISALIQSLNDMLLN